MRGENFPQGKIFKKFLGGWKIFPFRFLVNFDVFLVDFDAKIHMRGENLPKIPNGGWKITTRTTPQTGGGKIFFLSMSLWLVHVCSEHHPRRIKVFRLPNRISTLNLPIVKKKRKLAALVFYKEIATVRRINKKTDDIFWAAMELKVKVSCLEGNIRIR